MSGHVDGNGGSGSDGGSGVQHASPLQQPPPPLQPPPPPAAAAARSPANSDATTSELPIVCQAKKYIFALSSYTWKELDAVIRIVQPNKVLGHGGMRLCFDVEDLDEEGAGTPMVAKMFRHNISNVVEKDYFNEGEAQCMCEEFAANFNRIHLTSVYKPNISFLQCYVVRIPRANLPRDAQQRRSRFFAYKTEDTNEVMFIMEPKLSGHFTKYNSNYGETYKEEKKAMLTSSQARLRVAIFEAAEAFSHFTLVESGGSMLVCDLQGVNDFLTDPQIHTEDGKGLGMGNMGQDGIDKWVAKHTCNDICRALRLQPLNGVAPSKMRKATSSNNGSDDAGGHAAAAAAGGDAATGGGGAADNYYVALRAKLQGQAPVRPQDLVPLPKPLEEMSEDERLDYAMRLSALTS